MRLIGVLALAALVGASCAGTSTVTAPAEPTPTPQPVYLVTPPPRFTPAPTPEPTFRAKVGTPAAYLDGWKVILLAWEEQSSGRFGTPTPGMRYVTVIVRFENGSPTSGSFNPHNFNLQDSAGVRRGPALAFGVDRTDRLSSGQLAPGAFVSGSIIFEAPATDRRLDLIYEGYAHGQATWELY